MSNLGIGHSRIGRFISSLRPSVDLAANIGTFVTAVIAVVLLFSKDLVNESIRLSRENQQLLNEKLNLVNDKAVLTVDRETLRRSREMTIRDLDTLSAANRTLQASFSNTQSRLGSELAELTRLRASSTAERAEGDRLAKTASALSQRLLSQALADYLKTLRPGIIPYYPILYDPSDPIFRATADGDGASFGFVASEDSSPISQHPADVAMCEIKPGVHMVGAIYPAGPRSLQSIKYIKDSKNELFWRVCKLLSTQTNAYLITSGQPYKEMPSPIREYLYDMWRMGLSSPFLVIEFVPGASGGHSFEELREKFFWSQAVSWLYGDPRPDTDAALLSDATGFALLVQDAQANDLSGLKPLPTDRTDMDVHSKTLSEFNSAWLSYLENADLYQARDITPLMKAGTSSQFIERFKSSDIGNDHFWTAMSLNDVEHFNEELNCIALEFAVAKKYILSEQVGTFQYCETQKSLWKRMQTNEHAVLEELPRDNTNAK